MALCPRDIILLQSNHKIVSQMEASLGLENLLRSANRLSLLEAYDQNVRQYGRNLD